MPADPRLLDNFRYITSFNLKAEAKAHHKNALTHHIELLPHIQPMLDVYRSITEDAFTLVPDSLNSDVFNMVAEHRKALADIPLINNSTINPTLVGEISAAFTKHHEEAFKALSPYFPPYIIKKVRITELDTFLGKADIVNAYIEKVRTTTATDAEAIAIIKAKAEEMLRNLRDTIAEKGILERAINFKNTIDDHQWHARMWLLSAIGFATVLLCIACYFFEHIRIYYSNETGKNIQFALTKLVILGIFSYGLLVSIRNYQAHTHNKAVNKHRYNAILSYTSFVDPATKDDVRDKILTYVASCVFSPQDTGFTASGGSEGIGAKNIIEIFGKAGGKPE